MMHMEQRMGQRQQLVLNQKMQQALHILQLSGLELEHFVQQELEINPFLEQKQSKEELPAPPPDSARQQAADEPQYQESFDLDDWSSRWREGQGVGRNEDMEARRQFYEDSITRDESLRAHMLEQLRLATDDPELYEIGERIVIGDINERGYFTGDTAAIAEELGKPEERVVAALQIIQDMEPTGLGARDVVECLLMQIDAEFPQEEELRILVRDHFDALARRQIPQIAKAMKVTPDRVEQLKGLLATLNPWPGHEYSSEPTQYIAADVVVEKNEDDEFTVRLTGERVPELAINDVFHKTVKKDGSMTSEEKDYVRQKIESARWLTRNIAQRQQTILRVAAAIVDVQRDFLDKGIEHIRPLTLQVIADELGVHESTVARATRGKYIQTPQGLFELKFFFSPGLRSDNGEDQSSKSVQAAIKKLVEEEDKRKPLSDQKIADLLKEQGTNIARRTVTKYREALEIPSTTMRRQY